MSPAISRRRPLLRFLYKGGHVQDMQGEWVTIEHVMTALAALAPETGVKLRHFQVVAELDRRRYALHIEPSETLAPGQLRRLLAAFDRALGQANEYYTMFRTEQLLNPPRLCVMQQGWLEPHHGRPQGPQRPRCAVQARRARERP